MELFRLDHRTAVVTGGAKGIGAAIARMLEDAGASVAVFDIDSPDDLAFGSIAVDVTNERSVKHALARVDERFGGIDILVNNAGRVARKPATDLAVDEWQATQAPREARELADPGISAERPRTA